MGGGAPAPNDGCLRGAPIHWSGREPDAALIERYTLPEMCNIWSEEAKFQSWLDVEIAATEANCELGRVPAEAVATIKAQARFSV